MTETAIAATTKTRVKRGNACSLWLDPAAEQRLARLTENCKTVSGLDASHSVLMRYALALMSEHVEALVRTTTDEPLNPHRLMLKTGLLQAAGARL
jgi:hypothetical protein